MGRILTFEEFDARYGQPFSAPRTLTLKQFEARETQALDDPRIQAAKGMPPIPRRRPELTEGIEGLPAPKDVARTKPMVDLREGGQSFERTITVTEQGLNAGRPTNVPTIWDGQQLPDDEAVRQAISSRMSFPSYGSMDEAVQAAKRRSKAIGQAAGMTGRQPRTLTLEQFEAQEAAPETPSALESFYEGAIKAPARNLYAGYLQSGGGLYDLSANALEVFGRLGALDRGGKRAYRSEIEQLRGFAEEMYGDSLQYMDDNLLARVYQGLGAAPAAIAELISGTRLLGTAVRGFTGVEALHAADKGPKEVALASARGALVGGAFKAAAPLTRPARVSALTTIGGAQGAAAGGDVKDITAGAATLGILGLTGGRGHVGFRGGRRRPVKAQRQEPTLAPRTATPDTILDLTERVEPATPYTARVIREPSGAPPVPGRPAQRGAPFERVQEPVEPETVPAFPRVTIGGRELTFEQARVLSRAEKLPDAPFLVFDTRTVTGFEGIFPTVKEAEAFIDASPNGRFLDFGTPRQIEQLNPSGPESEAFISQRIKEVIGREFFANDPQTVTEASQFAPETPPVPPKGKHRTLADYLQRKGGLNDVGGDVRAALDRRNIMPGLINKNITYKDPLKIRQTSKRGMGLDTAASDAQQDGWFPELRHRTAEPADLIDALRREQAGEILDHPDNAAYIRYQEDSRAFEESEYARERAFDAEIDRQVEALEYDTADFPGYIEGTPPVPTRLTEEAGLVGGRPEEAARVDREAGAGGAVAREGEPTTELTEQGPQTVLPGAERTTGKEFVEAQADKRIKGTKAQKPTDEGLFDVAGRGQTELSLEEFDRRYSAQAEQTALVAPGAIRRTVRTPAGPAEVIFPDDLHARLFDLTGGKPDKAEARALYSELEGFVLERFNGPADTISLSREFRKEVLEEASARPGRESHAPLIIDPERQTAYFMQERVGQEAAELYTFPGPISGLKKQWHRAATEIIDSLAEGKYSPFARYLGGYPFKDPTIGRLPERAEYLGKRGETQGTIYRTNRMAGRLNDTLRKASEVDQRAALDYLTTEGADPKSLPLAVRGAAVAAKSAIKRVGRELVRRGMLSQEAYDAHADAYLPRVYLKHLMERSGFGAGLKISDQGYLKKRTDLPEEYRDLYLGEIRDVGFLVTKAISQPSRDLAMTDFLRDLSRNPEWVLPESIVEWTAPGMKKPRKVTPYWLKSEAGLLRSRAAAMPDTEQRARAREIADGMDALADNALGAVKGVPKDFRRMPDSPRYGDLRGLVVRKEIHDDTVGASDVWVGEKGAYDKTFDRLGTFNAFWKMMKVPFNPPTQIRNMVSNGVLLDLSGVPAQRLPVLYVRAFNEIRKNRKYYRIAVKHGIPASTFTAEELYRIRPDLLRVRGEKGGVVGKLAKMVEPLARLAKMPGDLYQFSETWGKVVKIIDAMEREGMSEREAVAAAQEALFDYSLVPPLVKALRSRPIGAPFITFYYKAFPAVMKGLIKHPGKFAKYLVIPYLLGDALVADLNDVTPEDVDKLRKALPGWLQDQGHVYLWPYRDESGRWDFVNFGYFLPWSMHERTARNTMQLATGSYEGSVNDFMSEVGVLSGPVPQIIAAIQTGVDPWTGREIVKDTDPPREQIYKLMMYAWRMGGPSWLTDQGVVGHMQRSLSGTPNYYGDPPMSPEQATGRAVGVNIYPVDPVQSRQRNIRRKVFAIERVQRDARRAMKNKGLSAERRTDLRNQYKTRIDLLKGDLKRYRKESKVHPNLRREAAR